ncbi:MAG: SDR family oxidoreductase, partial [Solirubrobacteraceae bacterium]
MFAQRGAAVALIARGQDALNAAKSEVERFGVRALALATDVADPHALEDATEEIERDLGPIDVWINNAMTSVFAPVHQITPEEYRRVTEVTYLGVVYGTLSALARMRERDRGVIVQVGSALAYRGIPLQSAYCASKHAIQGFTESLRCELMHEESAVQVTMVQMPALNTPQFDVVRTRLPRRPQPVPPIFQPEVAARAIVTAAEHPARREWWVGASTAVTLIGNALVPGIGDRYLARTGYDSQ